MNEVKFRSITFYKNYFTIFFNKQRQKTKDKILWTFRVIENQRIIPVEYFEHLTGTDGLYEIRVKKEVTYFASFVSLMKVK